MGDFALPYANEPSAPGWPGIDPRWTSSAKSGVGTTANRSSRVWFTLSHGILNEIYYPRIDQACTRDMGFLITAPDFFSEEKRDTHSSVEYLVEGVPAYRLTNICKAGRYRIEKTVLADPRHDALLEKSTFTPLEGTVADYRMHVLLAPHVANRGHGNTAWVGDYKGVPMLFAVRGETALALASTAPFRAASAGYVGISDGWQDLRQHGQLTWRYRRAADGNVALVAELDVQETSGEVVLVLGFGNSWAEAGNRARASLVKNFHEVRDEYIEGWLDWQSQLHDLHPPVAKNPNLYRVSTTVLRVHNNKRFTGGTIASLSIPWGFSKGDDDLGGYHLVWPRDLVETATGLLAAGAHDDALGVLRYLESTQEADGHWPQNMWLDGTSYWNGQQMDETAFPILLVGLLHRQGLLPPSKAQAVWPMVRQAASFVVTNGPISDQDRWEENAGYTPFTLAVEIAGLLVAAEMADHFHEPELALFLRETADFWNDIIEDLIYVTDSELAREVGVEGHYVRVAPPGEGPLLHRIVHVKNSFKDVAVPADALISQDALALVRFGLRAANDPRIVNTVKVIDHLLKVETPVGPCWRRYNLDGYGEHENGDPFNGYGVGRAWPLLAGERGHYELAAGRTDEARRLLETMAKFANQGGMLPEQVWDERDVVERELFFGQPTGSAMPLVWAHAEFVKLLRSVQDGKVFDMPMLTVERYITQKVKPGHSSWRFSLPISTLPAGRTLRIELKGPAMVHWTADDWKTMYDLPTRDTGTGLFVADLPTAGLPATTAIDFTFRWQVPDHWEGRNYSVTVA